MDKKRGVLLVALFLLVMMSFSVSAGYRRYITSSSPDNPVDQTAEIFQDLSDGTDFWESFFMFPKDLMNFEYESNLYGHEPKYHSEMGFFFVLPAGVTLEDVDFNVYADSQVNNADPEAYVIRKLSYSDYLDKISSGTNDEKRRKLKEAFLQNPTEQCSGNHVIGESHHNCIDQTIDPYNVYFFAYGSSDDRNAGNGGQYFELEGGSFKAYFNSNNIETFIDSLVPSTWDDNKKLTYGFLGGDKSKETCEGLGYNWLNKEDYPDVKYDGDRCCDVTGYNHDMYCKEAGETWMTFKSYCESIPWSFIVNPDLITNFDATDGSDGCCGDDGSDDIGYIFVGEGVNYICSFDGSEYSWQSGEDSIYPIVDIGIERQAVYPSDSSGATWVYCDADNSGNFNAKMDLYGSIPPNYDLGGKGEQFICENYFGNSIKQCGTIRDSSNPNYEVGESLVSFPSENLEGLSKTYDFKDIPDQGYTQALLTFSNAELESVEAIKNNHLMSLNYISWQINSSFNAVKVKIKEGTSGLKFNFGSNKDNIKLGNLHLTKNDDTYYYCTSSGDTIGWTNNLSKNVDGVYIGQDACKTNNFAWTGVSCCGDDTTSTSKEYYTVNPGEGYSAAGCYNGQYVKNGYSLYETTGNEEDKSVLVYYNETNYNPTKFVGCGNPLSGDGNNDGENTNSNNINSKISVSNSETCNSLAGYLCTDENKWEGFTEEKMIDAVQYISNSCGTTDLNCITVDEEVTSDNCQEECPEGRECSWRKFINDDGASENKCFVIPKDYSISSDKSGADSNCCPDNGCWDGENCVAELTQENNNELICYQNEWKDADEVKSWNPDRSVSNYCTQENYCFVETDKFGVNLDGDTLQTKGNKQDGEEKDLCPHTPLYLVDSVESGQEHPEDEGCAPGEIKTPIFKAPSVGGDGFCVPENYYLDYVPDDSETVGKIDAYCYKGKWISRSSLIAVALLNYTKENEITNYSLFCDNVSDSLNDLEEGTDLNNFCVLKYNNDGKEKRVSGTGLILGDNVFGDTKSSLGSLLSSEFSLPENYCNDVIENNHEPYNSFYPCYNAGEVKVWVNPYTYSILFTKYNLGFSFDPLSMSDWGNMFQNLISNPIGFIVNLLKGDVGRPSIFPATVPDNLLPVQNYNKLYFERLGNKNILGYVDKSAKEDSDIISMEYTNLSTDICEKVSKFMVGNVNVPTISCKVLIDGTTWKFNVISNIQFFKSLETIWTDLTSEIRLHSGGERPNIIMIEHDQVIPGGITTFTATPLIEESLDDADLKWEVQTYLGQPTYYGGCEGIGKISCKINFTEAQGGEKDKILLNVNNGEKIVEDEFIVNRLPVVSNLVISPENPVEGDTLTAYYTYSDADGDPEEGSLIKWYSKQELGGTFLEIQDENNNKLSSISLGAEYKFSVTPKDGYSEGDIKYSEPVTVGCSDGLELEEGQCVGCGDGIKQDSEECDDGNIIEGDGCSSSCKIEYLNCNGENQYYCIYYDQKGNCNAISGCYWQSEPDLCLGTPSCCGNGKIEGDEECDGNKFGGKTCVDFIDPNTQTHFTGGELRCILCIIDTNDDCDSSTTTTTASTTTTTTICNAFNDPCSSNSDCCSNHCFAGQCVECTPAHNNECNSGDCCSGDGKCYTPEEGQSCQQ